MSAIGTSMLKKTRKDAARNLKRTNLANHEVVLDRVGHNGLLWSRRAHEAIVGALLDR